MGFYLLPAGHGGRHAADPAAVHHRPWRLLPRRHALLFLALALHTAARCRSLRRCRWACSWARCWCLEQQRPSGRWRVADRPRAAARGHIHAVRALGDGDRSHPSRWSAPCPPAGQKPPCGAVRLRALRPCGGQHPFTIASAPAAWGAATGQRCAAGHQATGRLRTRTLGQRLRVPGRAREHRRPLRPASTCRQRRRQVWVAGGVSVTFLALLEHASRARPPRAPIRNPCMHYCTTRRATRCCRALLAVRAGPQPPMRLSVHDDALGQPHAQTLEATAGPLDIWFCGPLDGSRRAGGTRAWRLHRESFAICVDPCNRPRPGTQLCFGLRSRMPPLERRYETARQPLPPLLIGVLADPGAADRRMR